MSSTVAAWISGNTSETRSTGMPRIRSTSMPLFGLVETRMRFSAGGAFGTTAGLRGRFTRRILYADSARPLCAERAERARQSLFELRRRAQRTEAFTDELAQTPLQFGPLFTAGAEVEVLLDVTLLTIAELTVEKKIDDAFYIFTAHRGVPSVA